MLTCSAYVQGQVSEKKCVSYLAIGNTLPDITDTGCVDIPKKMFSKIIITAQDSISTDIKHKILVTETPPKLRIKNRKLIHLHKPTAIH